MYDTFEQKRGEDELYFSQLESKLKERTVYSIAKCHGLLSVLYSIIYVHVLDIATSSRRIFRVTKQMQASQDRPFSGASLLPYQWGIEYECRRVSIESVNANIYN